MIILNNVLKKWYQLILDVLEEENDETDDEDQEFRDKNEVEAKAVTKTVTSTTAKGIIILLVISQYSLFANVVNSWQCLSVIISLELQSTLINSKSVESKFRLNGNDTNGPVRSQCISMQIEMCLNWNTEILLKSKWIFSPDFNNHISWMLRITGEEVMIMNNWNFNYM